MLGCILVSFALSAAAAAVLPQMSEGMRILLLTVVISAGAAAIFPRREDAEQPAEPARQKEARAV